MASLEKRTSDGSDDHIGKTVHTAAYSLDERRRAALAEVDNAKFSYVTLASHPALPSSRPPPPPPGGSISKFAW